FIPVFILSSPTRRSSDLRFGKGTSTVARFLVHFLFHLYFVLYVWSTYGKSFRSMIASIPRSSLGSNRHVAQRKNNDQWFDVWQSFYRWGPYVACLFQKR